MTRLQRSILMLLTLAASLGAAWIPTAGRAAETDVPAQHAIAVPTQMSVPLTGAQASTPAAEPTETPLPAEAMPSPEASPEPTTEPTPEPQKPYIEEDIVAFCQMVWGEARGCAKEEQALCVWTVINRLEDGRFGDSILEIITKKNQFVGYSPYHPVTDEIRTVVTEVLEDWAAGGTAPALPPYADTGDYLYFTGGPDSNGTLHNWFREDWR